MLLLFIKLLLVKIKLQNLNNKLLTDQQDDNDIAQSFA